MNPPTPGSSSTAGPTRPRSGPRFMKQAMANLPDMALFDPASVPPPTTTAPASDAATLSPRKAPSMATMPDLSGMRTDQALAAVTAAGLRPSRVDVASGAAAGLVTSQSPPSGVKMPSGSTVYVESTPGAYVPPNAIPTCGASAPTRPQSELTAQGFTVTVQSGVPPPGTVGRDGQLDRGRSGVADHPDRRPDGTGRSDHHHVDADCPRHRRRPRTGWMTVRRRFGVRGAAMGNCRRADDCPAIRRRSRRRPPTSAGGWRPDERSPRRRRIAVTLGLVRDRDVRGVDLRHLLLRPGSDDRRARRPDLPRTRRRRCVPPPSPSSTSCRRPTCPRPPRSGPTWSIGPMRSWPRWSTTCETIVPTDGTQVDRGIAEWVSDWRDHVDDREAYVTKLATDPDARFEERTKGTKQLSTGDRLVRRRQPDGELRDPGRRRLSRSARDRPRPERRS